MATALYVGVWAGWLLSVDVQPLRSLSELGDFIGGAVAPIAIIWLVGTFLSQREELSETRQELARQAAAQEATSKVMLAQQILLRIPTANEAIFNRLWEYISNSEKTKEAYESKDLIYVVRRLRLLSDPETFYGTPASKKADMDGRGVTAALEFASAEVKVLCAMADEADSSGALRNLVETRLHGESISTWRTKAAKEVEPTLSASTESSST